MNTVSLRLFRRSRKGVRRNLKIRNDKALVRSSRYRQRTRSGVEDRSAPIFSVWSQDEGDNRRDGSIK